MRGSWRLGRLASVDRPWDVDFHLVRVAGHFHILTEPLAQVNQHLEGCLESGIDGQIISETNPASTTIANRERDR